MQDKRGGFRRLVVLLMVATAGVLTVGAHAAFAQGTLEICKSSANGMSGREFQFSVAGGPAITVKGGRCSGPFTSPHGTVAITELATTPPTEVDSIVVRPSARNLGLNGNTATVNVPAGSTAANETRITFTNVPGGGATGDFKVCKLTETAAFVGRLYTFHLNGGPGVSVEANNLNDDPSLWSCRLLGTFTQGTVVTLDEDIPAGQELTFIDSDPADCLVEGSQDTNTGTARYRIGSGVCVALYQNEPTPPSGTGFIEVCKDPAKLDYRTWDETVWGVPFDFTITEADLSTQDITVLGGQCSAPIAVAAGVTRVTEHATAGFSLVNVFTIPNDRLLDSNLINQTADVEVPVSDDPADETQVHFVNEHQRGQLKICKALGANSSVLEGKTFRFEADGPSGGPDNIVYIKAAASTQCKIVDYYPVGDTIEVDEDLGFTGAEYILASGPGCAYDRDGDLECSVTIKPGINTLTITNKALGKLEICKFVTDPLTDGEQFHKEFSFKIDGGATIKVRANRCSPPQLVSVGDHTVVEASDTNYELDPNAPGNGITVSPPAAEKSRNLLARSVTVTVPWAGDPLAENGAEVRVDYYNRIKRAQIKICKHVEAGSLDSLGKKSFDFTVTVEGDPNSPYHVYGVNNGECRLIAHTPSGEVVSFPILQPDGTGTTVHASEDGSGGSNGWLVSNVTLQGTRPGGLNGPHCLLGGCGTDTFIEFDLGPNTNTVHFYNRAKADP